MTNPTINLGSGEWATKDGELLGYSKFPSAGFLPQSFDFTRASTATVVNKQGLIESVASGVPRIDFSNDANGALLLEPQSTNLITYSEDFSDSSWSKTNITVNSDNTNSPSGLQNANLIQASAAGSINANYPSLTIGNNYTFSCFAKKGNNNWLRLSHVSSGLNGCWFDLENGIVGTVNSISATIENYGNGWYKCTNTFEASQETGTNLIFISLSDEDGGTAVSSGKNDYLWGAQLEQNSYATSYIPTSGTTQTRVAETCGGAGDSSSIGQTEGTIFIESQFSKDGSVIGLNKSFQNMIQIGIVSSGILRFIIYNSGNSTTINSSTPILLNNNYKIAVNYKSGNSKIFINGLLVGTSSDNITFNGALSELEINQNYFFSKTKSNTKDLRVYNTALSDEELIYLTGTLGEDYYNNYLEMSNNLNYNIQ